MRSRVVFTPDAREQFVALPATVKARVLSSIRRLERWPDVAGVKWLRHEWRGYCRIRVGDYRVIFKSRDDELVIVRVLHRSEVYDE